ncbi:phosphoenolpyruvate carboxykinase (ATP) [Daejeonella sp.]|jgi:phosphoenolpyruvate carboxykinase (ATP)|uniref:phosphoenolpyruvate carboxykinase (ATP) n=1 Tax=Daejeonella sp. TaxID=2805397 RepID=UPI0037850744
MQLSKSNPDLQYLNLEKAKFIHYQLSPSELIEIAITNGEAKLADSGALAADTGEFTGRSPRDRFIVCDEITEQSVWWGDVNIKFGESEFEALFDKVTSYLSEKAIYVRDAYACASDEYRLNIRVVTETAYQNLFANNLFLRPSTIGAQLKPEWTIIAAPGFKANPEIDGTRQSNFCIINFSKKMILIGGTGYTGEIKKGIFSVLNFILPHHHHVLSMHCSANVGKEGDTALFFGLSGTGKTTLSADPDRMLIGDDEHGWSKDSIFNFEGGCYAKCVDLDPEKEPQIFNAIRFGSLLENVNFYKEGRTVDFANIDKTENTRVAYPIDYIENALIPSLGSAPKNIFFLTADAFGVLPPISKLNSEQAKYHFISGYTAKVAGTEAGINEPQLTFSACFGKAFLPLHPSKYAELLEQNIDQFGVDVWLINTGWTGGKYGTGSRMKLAYTRAMIKSALNGGLKDVEYEEHPLFGLAMPTSCPGVPTEILNPMNTWQDKNAYEQTANSLAEAFVSNFKQYS